METLSRQCAGKSKQSGQRCKRRPIPGGTVCKIHGGGNPRVKAKADERLRALVDPAITRLEQLIQDPFGSVALAAVKDVLDRNDLAAKHRVEHSGAVATVGVNIDSLIAARLAELANRGQVPDFLALEGETEATDAQG